MNKDRILSILSIVTTLVGLVSSPMVANLIPAEWSGVVIAIGSLAQAFTKAIHHD